MKASDGTCCPHCGGTSGYDFEAWFREHHAGAWGGEAEATGSTTAYRYPKTVRCVDCGKRVAIAKAETDA